ncbi:MAG: Hsp20/alpha crystallin family protein [Thaumarchaeota archaeon]|jgi:HSP20 family protein|nr:Hsp20/alpha crystallin family protein [Nitrososphaerota archaeon]
MEDDIDEWFRKRRRYFEDIMKEIEREIDELFRESFKEFESEVPRELVRERSLPDGSKVREFGPFVYGYSVTIGPDGEPVVREFGNFRPEGRKGIEVKKLREPLVDVIEEEDKIRVVAEIPGVEKSDINLYATENKLTIKVDTPQRKYYREVDLPAKVDPKQSKSTYKNGVLEVDLKKVKEESKGTPLKVE